MISFTGLASGLDSGKLIDQLVAAEKAPAQILEQNRTNLGRQRTIVSDLASKLRALADAARGMDLASEVRARTASVSDSVVAVAVSGTATAGTHTARVTALARAQVTASRTFTTDAPGIVGTGGVTITVPGQSAVAVGWSSSDSLTSIAQRINDSVPGVDASVLYTGSTYQIVVTAERSGTANAPTFVDTGASANRLNFAVAGATKVAAANAAVTLDGIAITRSENVISDALPGVTMTLKTTHASGVSSTITIADDRNAQVAKIQSLVDAYNGVAGLLDGQLRYDGARRGADTLFGDSTLRRLQRAASAVVTGVYGGGSLRDLGVTLDTTGRLSLDKTKLDAALASRPSLVEGVVATGGLAAAIAGLADEYTRSGDGILAAKTAALTTRSDAYAKQIETIVSNADRLGERLVRQFTALEQAISELQRQGSALAGLFR